MGDYIRRYIEDKAAEDLRRKMVILLLRSGAESQMADRKIRMGSHSPMETSTAETARASNAVESGEALVPENQLKWIE